MIYAIRKSGQRLAPEIKPKGYYVEMTWTRYDHFKEKRKQYTVGPFPEYGKELLVEFMNLLENLHMRDGGAKLYCQVDGYAKWFGNKPGDTPLGLSIEAPHDDLDADYEYELTNYWVYYRDGISTSREYVQAINVVSPEDEPCAKSPFLLNLPQYHFERSMFVEAFNEALGSDMYEKAEDLCIETRMTPSFLLTNDGDERYIIHLPSGTIINWYKHTGRTNTCNKPGFGLDDLQEMLLLLKQELQELPD